MWLAYFVAFFASVGVLVWAGDSGMCGFDGVPRNLVAQIIVRAADWFLAVNDECSLLLGFLTMFVLPQWCAYLFAGASGAARRSRFVVFAWKWVALFIAKAFISASAVLMGIVLVGSYYGWLNPEPLIVVANAMTAMLLLIPGLGIFCTVPLKTTQGRIVSRRVRRVHKWMRRSLRKTEGDVARQIEREAREAAQQQRDVLHAVRCACGHGRWVCRKSRAPARRRGGRSFFAPGAGARIGRRSPPAGFVLTDPAEFEEVLADIRAKEQGRVPPQWDFLRSAERIGRSGNAGVRADGQARRTARRHAACSVISGREVISFRAAGDGMRRGPPSAPGNETSALSWLC